MTWELNCSRSNCCKPCFAQTESVHIPSKHMDYTSRQQPPSTTTPPHSRMGELDFLKCVFILLMITFHLVYIGDTHPWAKQVVYTFHMPGFLIISGYLTNTAKPLGAFLRSLLWIAVPYAVMESGYVVMASLLPIREHIDQLTPMVFLDHLVLHPLGPYWYLHTLVLCQAVVYSVAHLPRLSPTTRMLLAGLLFYGLAAGCHVVSLPCALYFLGGAVVRQGGLRFTDFFKASPLALVVFVVLVAYGANLDKATAGGVLIVYSVISFCLWTYRILPHAVLRPLLFIGRNTLPLFLFSPMFTIVCKGFLPYVLFDPSGSVYLALSLPLCVVCSLVVAHLLELTRLAPLMFGKAKIIT